MKRGPASRTLRAALLACSTLAAAPFTAVPAIARQAPDSFADLAAKLLPAVVNVSSTTEVKTTAGLDI